MQEKIRNIFNGSSCADSESQNQVGNERL